jgi:hypothetical protein
MEELKGEVEKIESELAQHVAGLGNDAMNGRGGIVRAVNLAGPFIMSSQGTP